MKEFPDDDDGDVLRGLQEKGVDLSQPREIEFYCYAENESKAIEIAGCLNEVGFKSEVFYDDEAPTQEKCYSVYSAQVMIPSYDDIVKAQSALNLVLSSFNTRCDGWGTLVDPN